MTELCIITHDEDDDDDEVFLCAALKAASPTFKKSHMETLEV